MAAQLLFLVKNSNDPAVAIHALQYVQPNPKMDFCLKLMVSDFRRELTSHLTALTTDPTYVHGRPSERSPLVDVVLKKRPLELEQTRWQTSLMTQQREIFQQQQVLLAQQQVRSEERRVGKECRL